MFSMRCAFMSTNIFTSILKSSNELITSGSFHSKRRISNAFTSSEKFLFKILFTLYFVPLTNQYQLAIWNLWKFFKL